MSEGRKTEMVLCSSSFMTLRISNQAATMSYPKGVRANPASLKCRMPKENILYS